MSGRGDGGKIVTIQARRIDLIAVNHWQTAINTHSLNHPRVRHICEPVENLHPLDLIKSGHLDLLAASCECRFHSNARGGGPCNEQSRSQPWQLVRWATDMNIDAILMENVRMIAEIGIRARMLQPHELAAAHSFPKDYQLTGNKSDQTKQIGNSVPVELARAHAEVLLC